MKNIKAKKLSKGIFLGFFVFQFAFGTSFAPIIANAEEIIESESSEISIEEVQITSEETQNTEDLTEEVIATEIENNTDSEVSEDGDVQEEEPEFNQSVPGDEERTLVPTTGSITVCKIVIDVASGYWIVEDWNTIPGSNTFTVNFLEKPETLNSSFDEAGIPSSVVFDTATDNVNASIFQGSKGDDANCVTRDDLDLGGYFYSQEVVEGDNLSDWSIQGYSDGANGPFVNSNSLSAYDDTLFTIGDSDRNTNSDGHIILTEQNPNRTLVIINRYNIETESPENTPPLITVIPEEVQVIVGANCDEAFIMNGVTAEDVEDGNITSGIIYSGNVDCNTPGSYEVCYNVTDLDKVNPLSAEEKCRTIIVTSEDPDEPENPSCDSQAIWARVVVTSYSNVGAGNMTNTIYLGSSVNTVASGEWFALTPADVLSIQDFADIPGLAVKRRVDNKIVIELHGSHLPKGTGQESVEGYIEFYNGVPTTLVGASGQDKLETPVSVGHEDLVWISGDKAYFDLAVSTADDRFSTTYEYSYDEDCEEDDDGGGNGGDDGDDDDNDGGDDGDDEDNGGGGGGGNSSGSILGGGSNRQGEVLGATDSACAQFTQYHDTGDTQSEVTALQTFLNEYMNAGLTVNGIYDRATTQAIHNFQALHWDAIIKPWLGGPSKISPNTTGRTRQMTTQALNFIMDCPNDEMYLEDPKIFYKLTEIKNKKEFTADQIMKISNLLNTAHGIVLGAEVMEK